MNVAFSGGTARQRQWVSEALATSRYPYDWLDANVTVTWAPTTPCALKHTYMCTKDEGGGAFTITIEDWADDPTHPRNAGLPDPAADIKTYYMESFIHETGHVAHFVLVNSDPLRTQAAGLFWKADLNAGTGRRYGTLADYDHNESSLIVWADSIIEAIADCVKCAFYQGRLIYGNRTNWRIDADKWAALMALVQGGSAISGGFRSDFSATLAAFGASYNSHATSAGVPLHGGGAIPGVWIESDPASGVGYRDSAEQFSASMSSVRMPQVWLSPFLGSCATVYVGRSADGSDFSECANVLFGTSLDGSHYANLMWDSGGPRVELGSAEYVDDLYLVCRRLPTSLVAELWNADPWTAPRGSKLASVSVGHSRVTPASPAVYGSAANGNLPYPTPHYLVLTDWRCEPLLVEVPAYPFATTYGTMQPGPGSAGQIRIAAATF